MGHNRYDPYHSGPWLLRICGAEGAAGENSRILAPKTAAPKAPQAKIQGFSTLNCGAEGGGS